MWQQWTNLILGIVLIAAPFIGLSTAVMTWTLVGIGIAIAALALWGAQETNIERENGKMTY